MPTSTPLLALDDTQHAVGGFQTSDCLAVEVEVSRRVDEIDFGVHPLRECYAEVDGVAPLGFFRGVVGERRTVSDVSMSFAGAGHEGEGIDEGRLATRSVAHYSHVSDIRAAIVFHDELQVEGQRSKVKRP